MKLEYFLNVIDGKIQQYLTKKIFDDIAGLKNGRYWLEISSASKRSIAQNNYLHQLFTLFSKELIDLTGDKQFNKDKIKDIVKQKFLLTDVITPDGEIIGQYVKHTADLNKQEMGVFIDKVLDYAMQEFDIELPAPNTQFDIDLDFQRTEKS